MSIPEPPIALESHCSAIWNNTLYVYSPQGFQSLPLEAGAEWKELESGQSVRGGLCVPARNQGSEALYIVGGRPDGAVGALQDYPGLQRYNFQSETWETITPTVPITQNRQNHGATFISSLNAILVYSGSQDGVDAGLSTQTFLISTEPPFATLSFNSQGAPALNAPMVMPWSADQAIVVGGSASNTEVWLFGQPQGWTNLGTQLPPGLGLDAMNKKCTIVTGDDGSKVLQIFDFGATPNMVTRYALEVNGAPAPVGQQVGMASPVSNPPARRRSRSRRQLTVNNWPAYNSTFAPSTSRTDVSLAQNSNGMAVISGGDPDEPLVLFDQEKNAWMNATDFFVLQDQTFFTDSASSSSSSISSATASATSSAPTSSNTAGVLGTGQSKDKVMTTLGATLGAIFGLAAILIIVLMFLRWKKQKRQQQASRTNEKEDRLSFADQGADFMSEAQGTRSRGLSATKSANSSLTSLQMFQNKSLGHRKGMPSDGSQAPIVKNKSPLGVSDPMEMSQMSNRSSPTFTTKSLDIEKTGDLAPPSELTPAAAAALAAKGSKEEKSRSNGWSRYFANNEVTNLASMQGGARNTYNTETSEMSKSSDYDDNRKISQGSAVQPLELNLGPKFEGQRLSNVVTGSPTMGQSLEDIQQGMSAEIRRAGSTSSRGSGDAFDFSNKSTPATQQTTYTPAEMPGYDRRADTRSISSSYSGSNPFFGGSGPIDPRTRNGSAGAHSMPKPQFNLRQYGDQSRDSTASNVTVFPGGESPKNYGYKQRADGGGVDEDFYFPKPGGYFGNAARDSSASNVTIFPGAPAPTPMSGLRGSGIAPVANRTNAPPESRERKMTAGEDMNWVNLKA